GISGAKTIFAIRTYQQRVAGMNPPDGRVDPGGKTFQFLIGQPVVPPTPVRPAPTPVPVGPGPGPGAQDHEFERAVGSTDSEIHENLAGQAELAVSPLSLTSRSFDPYRSIRSALPPQYANLDADDVTAVLGRMPAALVLHQFLNSPQMRQAAQASVLGNGSRTSVLVHGSGVPPRAYFHFLSRLHSVYAAPNENHAERFAESEREIPQSMETPSTGLESTYHS